MSTAWLVSGSGTHLVFVCHKTDGSARVAGKGRKSRWATTTHTVPLADLFETKQGALAEYRARREALLRTRRAR